MNSKEYTIASVKSLADVEAIEEQAIENWNLPSSTYELIRRSAELRPDHPAIRYIENGDHWNSALNSSENSATVTITYSDFLSNLHRTANLLRSLGATDTDSVSMVLPNVPEAHYILWGAEACCIVNPVNYLLEAKEIGDIVESAGSKILVVHGEHTDVDTWAKLPAILDSARCVEHVIVVGGSVAYSGIYVPFYEAILSQPGDRLMFDREIMPEHIASLFHTGGTTGLPKLAQHTHGNEVYIAWALNRFTAAANDTCYLVGLPLFHCNAAIATGLTVFAAGGTVLLTGINGFRTPGVLANLYAIIEHFGVTNFSAVPTVYGVLSQLPVDGHDLSSMRFAVCGAAPMPVELFNKFQKHTGIPLTEGYGLTEATVCNSMTPPDSEPQRIGSIGIRLPYTQMKSALLSETKAFVRECEVDEVGSLLIAGPAVTPGYTDASRNEGLFVSDDKGQVWLNSGDLARADADGFFWLTGREKELIIRGGHNIDPGAIEEVLAQHPAVNLVAAVGRPDKYAGEIPVAYVDTCAPVSVEELIAFCEESIGERAAIPKDVIILDALPVTGVGKIHKPTLCLMELKSLVDHELDALADKLTAVESEAVADKKYGNVIRVKAIANNSVSAEELESEILELLDAYSFRSELTVE